MAQSPRSGQMSAGTKRAAPTNHQRSFLGARSLVFMICNYAVIRVFITLNKNHQHLQFSKSHEGTPKTGNENLNTNAPNVHSCHRGAAQDGTPIVKIILKHTECNLYTLGHSLQLCPHTWKAIFKKNAE